MLRRVLGRTDTGSTCRRSLRTAWWPSCGSDQTGIRVGARSPAQYMSAASQPLQGRHCLPTGHGNVPPRSQRVPGQFYALSHVTSSHPLVIFGQLFPSFLPKKEDAGCPGPLVLIPSWSYFSILTRFPVLANYSFFFKPICIIAFYIGIFRLERLSDTKLAHH